MIKTTIMTTLFLESVCGLSYLTLYTAKSSGFDVGRHVDFPGLAYQPLSNFGAQGCHPEIWAKGSV